MSRIIFTHVFTIFVYLSFFRSTLQQSSLQAKSFHEERFQVIKEALNWMTFRKNGQLATSQDLEPFFEAMKQRYRISRHYRTLIVAFKYGVLPKLTLQMNDACDPAYTLEYRDTSNNSVTDGLLKRFLIKSYDKRKDKSRQFCDYRQGLVCNTQTKKCECPEGSTMGPISQGSKVERCLVEENKVCSLIDLDHDPTSKYGALKKLLPVMMFNLEKPLSCKMGTQCRFKSTSQSIPMCYGINDGPWISGRWKITFGNECTLGLYGDTGPCGPRDSWDHLGVLAGYTCYNFGPRSRTKSVKVGICAHESGSYGISNSLSGWDPMFIGFVSPATVPLRGKELHDYYRFYLDEIFGPFLQYSFMITKVNERCDVTKTEKFLDLWKFFQSLEGTPPQGQDYVAKELELNTSLKSVEDLSIDWGKRACGVYTLKQQNDHNVYIKPALQCIPKAPTDADGNDGTCQKTPEADDLSKDYAETFMKYKKHVEDIQDEEKSQEEKYRKDLLEAEELTCDPKLGSTTENGVLLIGACPQGKGCYQDYGDYQGIYDDRCRLKDPNRNFKVNCQDLNENRGLGSCEEVQLQKKAKEELENLAGYSKLRRGDKCQYDLEKKIRSAIKNGDDLSGNLYSRLVELQEGKYGVEGKGFCGRTKLLECTQGGTCECLPRTDTRSVTIQGREYTSDYCYVASEDCGSAIYDFDSLVQGERNEIKGHYESVSSAYSCGGSNWCVFYDDGTKECTTKNTGTTGYFPDRNSGKEPGAPCYTDECGYQEAGGAEKDHDLVIKMIILIEMINFVG